METRTERLVHLGGLIGALGGIAWIIGLVLAGGESAATMQTYSPMMLGGLIAMGIGLMAGHLRLSRRTGIMGSMALAISVFSLLLLIGTWFAVESHMIDVIYFAMAFMLTLVSFSILALMGLSSGGIYRPALVLLIVSLLAMPFMDIRTGFIWPGVAFGLAWVWIGLSLVPTESGRETLARA